MRTSLNPIQTPADAAVVIPTILRPALAKAVRSVFTQNFAGRIHLLIGVDVHQGDSALLDQLAAECPSHITLTILDPGYSTSVRHGGLQANAYGGSLRTVLSYLANAPHIAYLDDNDWWGANHLTLLKTAIAGKQWAWSGRWMVHPQTGWPICRDEWDSVGPGKGINADRFGGFVQPSGLMMDAQACHLLMPLWSMAAFADGGGEDRLIFDHLNKSFAGAGTGHFTSFCTLTPDSLGHDHHKKEFLARGLGWIYQDKVIGQIIDLMGQSKNKFELNQFDMALDLVEQVLDLNPHLADALCLWAKIKHSQNKTQDAVAGLAHSLEADDSLPERIALLADWLHQMGHAEAESRARNILKLRFNLPDRP